MNKKKTFVCEICNVSTVAVEIFLATQPDANPNIDPESEEQTLTCSSAKEYTGHICSTITVQSAVCALCL
jgi:hypothetical protein